MAPRANWKGFLKVGELTCPVALYTAASTSERIAFHILNRRNEHRVHREFVDEETGKPVEREDQVKGYEVSKGNYVVLEPEEIAAAIPESDKTLNIESFVPCDTIDEVFFDRPYYLAPSSEVAETTFALLRDGMRQKKVAALAQTVLFRRVRTLLIRPHGKGMIGTTLNFDYEVRPAKTAFKDVSEVKIEGEMLDLAEHIIDTKKGSFDPEEFEDRYEAALTDLVKAKLAGKPIPVKAPPKPTNVVDLMDALRQSAGAKTVRKPRARKQAAAAPSEHRRPKAASKHRAAPGRRKAG